MAEESSGTTPSIFDLDPNGMVDLDDQPDGGQPQSAARASTTTTDDDPQEQSFEAERPADLPAELAERWEAERRKHQRNYQRQLARLTKDKESVQTLRDKAAVVDRFYSDPQYASQTIQTMAKQLGYELHRPGAPAGQGNGQSATTESAQMPSWVTQAVNEAMADNPDLAFLAPIIAKAAWSISETTTKPLHEEMAARKTADVEHQAQTRQAEFERMAAELEDEGVDWREHEDEMLERLQWMQNALAGKGSFLHPKYGNFLKLLHSVTVGPRAAQAEAGRRMQQAMVNKTSTGTAARSPGVNTDQLIKEAKTPQDRWKIAFQAALAEVPLNARR